MSSAKKERSAVCHHPQHYEETRIEGMEHPADVTVDRLPTVRRHRRKLARLYCQLQSVTTNQDLLRVYVDARSSYESERESRFYDVGFDHGLLVACRRQLKTALLKDPLADGLVRELDQIMLSTELPKTEAIAALLTTATARVISLGYCGDRSEAETKLAAVREALWPGGNMDHQWSPDTIEEIARIARPPKGVAKKGKRHG
jgi:hypothetical protein